MHKSNNMDQNSYDFGVGDESFLRDFFENSPIGFHVFGPDKIIQAMNQSELDMLEYSKNEIIGSKKWSDLIIEEQKAQFEQHWKDICTSGRVTNLRYTLITKNNSKWKILKLMYSYDNKTTFSCTDC